MGDQVTRTGSTPGIISRGERQQSGGKETFEDMRQREMFSRSLNTTSRALARSPVAQQVRHNSSLPIPPKIATPKSVQGPGGNSARMDEVVNFYKALPKGNVAVKKGPFTNPGNGKPIVWTIGALFLIGYTIDYQMHLKHHKNRAH
ncbi:unnamed protein product [Sympodiomycopsis kandeliae]